MKHQKDITYAIVNIKDNRENISFGIKMTWTWKKHDSCFPIFFAFYVFFSLSPTIQGTLGKGKSRPVRTSTSNSSRFLRRPSDYCSDITSMMSSLNRIFHLNQFKDFYTHDTLTNDADYAILDLSLAYDSGKTCIL